MNRILSQVGLILHGESLKRHSRVAGLRLWVAALCAGAGTAIAQVPVSAAPSAPASAAIVVPNAPRWMVVPRIAGRITSRELGLVINTADPYSVEVGEFYARERRLPPAQVLRVELPVRAALTPAEFEALAERIEAYFGPSTEALALAWTLPYAVNCNSITGALALGYDDALCAHTCAPSRPSPFFFCTRTTSAASSQCRPTRWQVTPTSRRRTLLSTCLLYQKPAVRTEPGPALNA